MPATAAEIAALILTRTDGRKRLDASIAETRRIIATEEAHPTDLQNGPYLASYKALLATYEEAKAIVDKAPATT